MYFPYLRDKQSEMLALRELCKSIQENNKIIPIIEPVTSFRNTKGTLKKLIKHNINFVLIENPSNKEYKNDNTDIKDQLINDILKDYKNYIIGYCIKGNTTLEDIKSFIKTYPNKDFCFIHTFIFNEYQELNQLIKSNNNFKYNILMKDIGSNIYIRNNVKIEESFQEAPRNADYEDEDFFSNNYLHFKNNGYEGFGDYMTERVILKSGFTPHAVAIHLTYLHDNNNILCKHFVSDDKVGTEDTEIKLFQALKKLVDFVNNNKYDFSFSSAVKEFTEIYNSGKNTSLANIKKLSFQHHLELMMSIL